jgi:hypothetical protein
MNTIRIATIATLMLAGFAAAEATEVAPAWSEDGFVMEEIVVRAEAPASYYMEEVVVTANLPVVDLDVTQVEPATVAQVPNSVMEEIVVTAHPDELRERVAARIRNFRNSRLF